MSAESYRRTVSLTESESTRGEQPPRSPARLRLLTFGGLSIQDEDGPPLGPAASRRQPLALLAILALAGSMGSSRDKLASLLWPESTADQARNALKQLIFSIRRDLRHRDVVVGSNDLRLNPDAISTDVGEFVTAISKGDLARAGALYAGPFLDGVYLRSAPEFTRWMEGERARLAALASQTFFRLATAAEKEGAYESASIAWRRLATFDPCDARAALGVMRTLAASGDRTGALQHGRIHTALVRSELDADPDPAVVEYIDRLRMGHDPSVAEPHRPVPAVLPAPPAPIDKDASIAASASAPVPVTAPRQWPVRRVTAGLLAAGIAGVVIAVSPVPRAPAAPRVEAAAVAPFRVRPADSPAGFLRDGMVDLLAAALAGGDSSWRIVDPAAMLGAPSAAGDAPVPERTLDDDIAAARHAGASRLIRGAIVSNAGPQLIIAATIIDVRTSAVVASAQVSGRLDSVPSLVDQLAGQLLAAQAGEGERRLSILRGTPLPAVKDYLAGREAERRGDYGLAVAALNRALAADSTFALAASELGQVAGWIADDGSRRRAYQLAWRHQERLGALDRAVVSAMLGPQYPAGSPMLEFLAGWERVASLEPEQPDGWYESADLLFHDPWLTSHDDRESLARARALFARALERAPTYGPALQHLLQLAAHDGDTQTVARVWAQASGARISPSLRAYLAWRVATAQGDSAAHRAAWAELAHGSLLSLQWVAMTSQEDGIALEDAARALDMRLAGAVTDEERMDALLSRHALALNSGDHRTAESATVALTRIANGRKVGLELQVLDVIYGGLPEGPATTDALRELDRGSQYGSPSSSVDETQRAVDRCIVAQWHLWKGSPAVATQAAVDLRRAGAASPSAPWAAQAATCALLIDAAVAVRTHADAAPTLLDSLDGQLARGVFVTSRPLWDATVMASTQVFESAGQLPRAYEASRRRIWFYRWPHYLAEQLYATGRLGARVGAQDASAAAYRHFVALRGAARDPRVPAARRALETMGLASR